MIFIKNDEIQPGEIRTRMEIYERGDKKGTIWFLLMSPVYLEGYLHTEMGTIEATWDNTGLTMIGIENTVILGKYSSLEIAETSVTLLHWDTRTVISIDTTWKEVEVIDTRNVGKPRIIKHSIDKIEGKSCWSFVEWKDKIILMRWC